MRNLPVKQLLQIRRVLLIKDCSNSDEILRILSLISSDSNDFVDLCYMCDMHCSITNEYILRLYYFANNLRVEGLI